MSLLLSLLIVAALPRAPIDSRQPDAVEVFHSGFEETADGDVDGWPDGWMRQRGPHYPAYLPVRIVATEAPEGHYALRIGLNGGAASISTPPIEVSSVFSYVLEGYIKTDGLKNDRAYISLTFQDGREQSLQTLTSERVRHSDGWKKIRLGPFTASSDKVHSATIGLHLEPSGDMADLQGEAWFDDVWLARLPHMALQTNQPSNIYEDGSRIDIHCKVSGIFERNPVMKCELLDALGKPVGTPVFERLQSEHDPAADNPEMLRLSESTETDKGFVGSMHWKPVIQQPGFYRARVTLEGNSGKIVERHLTLAVIAPRAQAPRGEFGWTLPRGDQPLSYSVLAQLLPRMGLNWVKLPIWLDENDVVRLDELVNFAERLAMQRIETVGLLMDPPASVRPRFGDSAHLTAAAIFSAEPELWYKSLEPITTRLSLQVHWWQLGGDDDTSFSGDPHLSQRVASVKKQLEQFGQTAHLGFAWRMLNEPPRSAHPAWDFLSLTAQPPLTEQELSQYLPTLTQETKPSRGKASRPSKVAPWIELAPLPRAAYALPDRISDLVHRMVAAKRFGAAGIFIPQPFDAEQGLMNEDGTPGELLVPWRTAALALAGSEYLGSITLPQGSQNHLFLRDGEIVMVVWNSTPVQEDMFLGEHARQIDVWGKVISETGSSGATQFAVGPIPSFITGASEPIVRWNMAVAFEKTQLPSIFGTPHENHLVVKNFFPQGTAVQVRMHTPEAWQTSPRVMNLKLAADEQVREPLTIRLPVDATNGRYPIKIDFNVTADRDYQFSVYRELDVGLGDVVIEMSSHLNAQGDLEVEQIVTNKTDALLSFKCSLYAPDRRRLVSQITRLGQQRDIKRYRLPDGKSLIGKTISLRAEEVGGERTFNFRFVAKE